MCCSELLPCSSDTLSRKKGEIQEVVLYDIHDNKEQRVNIFVISEKLLPDIIWGMPVLER